MATLLGASSMSNCLPGEAAEGTRVKGEVNGLERRDCPDCASL